MAEAAQLTAREELEEIAAVLREADETEKEAKKLKDEVRGPFFDLISEVVREEVPLAREIVTVELHDSSDAFNSETWRRYNYPLHNIVAIQPESDGEGAATRMVVTLEESDQYKKYEFVADGYKFGRSIRMEGKGFEAESFISEIKARKLPAALKKKLLALVKEEVVTVTNYLVDEAGITALMAEDPSTVAVFQEFINPGTPKAALIPIKAVKEQEE